MSAAPVVLNSIFEYIDSKSVMCLSTAGIVDADAAIDGNKINDSIGGGFNSSLQLRATPVFFARRDKSFYFISVAKTVHAANISQNHNISAAITDNYKNYRDIKGVQIFGRCAEIERLPDIARAALIYFSKFSDLKSFMQPEVLKSALDIGWYELRAKKLIYTDNGVRFGYKEEIDL